MQLQNILFYSVILPNILFFWCRIFVFGLTWKILFRSNPRSINTITVINGRQKSANGIQTLDKWQTANGRLYLPCVRGCNLEILCYDIKLSSPLMYNSYKWQMVDFLPYDSDMLRCLTHGRSELPTASSCSSQIGI